MFYYVIIIAIALFARPLAADETAANMPTQGDIADTAIIVDAGSIQSGINDTAVVIVDSSTQSDINDTAVVIVDTSTQSDINGASAHPAALLKSARAAVYDVRASDSAARFGPAALTEAEVFRSDGADAAEIMRYRALTGVYVPSTLSSSFNRFLPYGNTAQSHGPRHPAQPYLPLLIFPYDAARFWGAGMVSAAQSGGFGIDPCEGFLHYPYPAKLMPPELTIFWENGVFEQNTLNLRLSRPLSPNLMMSLFSDYRYFAGKRFNHERNDIANFYTNFYADTSRMVNHGYNPLVDEHMMGGAFLWAGADSSELRVSFTYGNLANEYALNRAAPSLDRLLWARLDRRLYRVDASLTGKNVKGLDTEIKAAFVNETRESSYRPDSTVANWEDASNSFIIEAQANMTKHFGAALGSRIVHVEHADNSEKTYVSYYPEIFYNRGTTHYNPLLGRRGAISYHARMGMNIYTDYTSWTSTIGPDGDAIYRYHTIFEPEISAVIKYLPIRGDSLQFSVYTETSPLPATGAEIKIPLRHIGLLLAYQRYNPYGHPEAGAWLGPPPYLQPARTLIIAPWVSRIGGFSLMSKTFITDTKPHIKTSTSLSRLTTPRGMAYTFETVLGFDYWSERDPVLFAGHYGWNMPIYDLNLKIAAHIKTFRLFYKVDNLLNMRNAYVPGYFSPGVTFRWGLNWYIQ